MRAVNIKDYLPREIPTEDWVEGQDFAGKKIVISAGQIFVSDSLQNAIRQADEALFHHRRSKIQAKSVSRDEFLNGSSKYISPLTSNRTKYLSGCSFAGAHVEIHGPATLLECELDGATININNDGKIMVVKANLANATMTGNMQHGWLANVKASKPAKINAHIAHSHIAHSHLGNMHFSGNLTDTHIHNSHADDTTSFAGASFSGHCGINDCNIPQSSFAQAKGSRFIVIKNGVQSPLSSTQQTSSGTLVTRQEKQH